jgi:hypothetical protein
MSFDLFGFDCIPHYGIYGAWIGCVTNEYAEKRSLACIHRAENEWRVELFWMRLV